jgi:hypothetical protein
MFTKDNAIKGGAAAIATMIALNLTSGRGKLIQGAAAVVASMGALVLAAKFS